MYRSLLLRRSSTRRRRIRRRERESWIWTRRKNDQQYEGELVNRRLILERASRIANGKCFEEYYRRRRKAAHYQVEESPSLDLHSHRFSRLYRLSPNLAGAIDRSLSPIRSLIQLLFPFCQPSPIPTSRSNLTMQRGEERKARMGSKISSRDYEQRRSKTQKRLYIKLRIAQSPIRPTVTPLRPLHVNENLDWIRLCDDKRSPRPLHIRRPKRKIGICFPRYRRRSQEARQRLLDNLARGSIRMRGTTGWRRLS